MPSPANARPAVPEAAPVPEGPGEAARIRFSPAPRIPTPYRAARPSKRFVPVAGMIIEDKRAKKGLFKRRQKEEPVAEEPAAGGVDVFDDDQTPAWVYKTILVVSILGAFYGFLFWNSSSELIGPTWKLALLVEMVTLSIIALVVWVRLARKMSYGSRFVAWLARRRDAMMTSLQNAAAGVVQAGKGIKSGGGQFREGLQAKKESGVVGKAIGKIIQFFAKIILGIIRLIVGIFRLIYRIYVRVVQLLWAVYRGIAEPILFLAFRIVRWALKVVWRVLRWALQVVWKIFYWLVRRWPIKYVTRLLEEPVRVHARYRVLLTNVVVSDLLGAPVKPRIREAAEPYVGVFGLHRETRRAARLIETETQVESERDLWLTIPTPEERRARAEERKRRKAEEKAAAKQAAIDEKEAKKEAKQRRKEEIKKAKEEGRDLKAEEKEAKKKAKKEAGAAEEAPVEAAEATAEEEGKKGKKKEKKPKRSRKEKKELKKQEKLEKAQAKKDAKGEKKEAKKAAKEEKKSAKKDKKSTDGEADAAADATGQEDKSAAL